MSMAPDAPRLGSSLEWIQAAWTLLEPTTSLYRSAMQSVLHEVNDAVQRVYCETADSQMAVKARAAGRVVLAVLWSLDR